MKFREWWIEFQGDSNSDSNNERRYVGGVKFEPMSPGDEVIHVIEAEPALTRIAQLEAEIKLLRDELMRR